MTQHPILREYFNERAKKGGNARWANKTDAERKAHARLMVEARLAKKISPPTP